MERKEAARKGKMWHTFENKGLIKLDEVRSGFLQKWLLTYNFQLTSQYRKHLKLGRHDTSRALFHFAEGTRVPSGPPVLMSLSQFNKYLLFVNPFQKLKIAFGSFLFDQVKLIFEFLQKWLPFRVPFLRFLLNLLLLVPLKRLSAFFVPV